MGIKIKQLFIKDFGILRNQNLADIGPGLVIIGGLNRAGKSTFMQILRYLAYGFPKVGLPPANSKYAVEADLQKGSETYSLNLSGYGAPIFKKLKGDDGGEGDIYPIDGFTYRQLFTISLEELAGLKDLAKDDRSRLQSILLGGGFKDVMLLPQLAQGFNNSGEVVGGKKGNPRVKKFKPYSENILAGQALKEKGLSQIAIYQTKQDELETIKAQIESSSRELPGLKSKVGRLDLVKNIYEDYQRFAELERQLADIDESIYPLAPSLPELPRILELKEDFLKVQQEIAEEERELNLSASDQSLLLEKKDKLAGLMMGISGIKERVRLLKDNLGKETQKKADLELKLKRINSSWNLDNIEQLKNIRTDIPEQEQLSGLIARYKDLLVAEKDLNSNIVRLQQEEETWQKDLEQIKGSSKQMSLKKYLTALLFSLLLGLGLSFLNPVWFAAAIIGIIGATGIYLKEYLGKKANREILWSLQERLKKIRIDLELELKGLVEYQSELKVCCENLDYYKDKLELEKEIPYETLSTYLIRVEELQGNVFALEGLEEEIRGEEDSLSKEYKEHQEFLEQFTKESMTEGYLEDYYLKGWQDITLELAKWQGNAEKAKSLAAARKKETFLKESILTIVERTSFGVKEGEKLEDIGFLNYLDSFLHFLQDNLKMQELFNEQERLKQRLLSSLSSDMMKEYFLVPDSKDQKELLASLQREYAAFANKGEVEEEYKAAVALRDEETNKLQRLKEKRREWEKDLEDLASAENLYKGQRMIDSNREKLKVLGREYAVNMLAAHLLKEIERNLLFGMKDEIMNNAGRLFSRLTRGEYKGIMPSEHLLDSDFEAYLEGQNNPQTVDMLSRGTREQLYLAVRISRIMDIKPPLPVIIDDSLANFDSPHLEETVNILGELAKTHQIFILTCHSSLLDYFTPLSHLSQYWKLVKGQFTLSNQEELKEYLR